MKIGLKRSFSVRSLVFRWSVKAANISRLTPFKFFFSFKIVPSCLLAINMLFLAKKGPIFNIFAAEQQELAVGNP